MGSSHVPVVWRFGMNKADADTTINRILKLLRNAEGISAKELAKRVGLSPAYISEIETGKKEPTLKVLNAYGSFFGISPANLLYIQEENLSASNAELIVKIFEKKVESENQKTSTVSKLPNTGSVKVNQQVVNAY
jgi:transcriptional regulator with XRE-family HTH domain